jgi:hypothetical protein
MSSTGNGDLTIETQGGYSGRHPVKLPRRLVGLAKCPESVAKRPESVAKCLESLSKCLESLAKRLESLAGQLARRVFTVF